MDMSTVVVGIDGSPASQAALRIAIDEAVLRGWRVLAVTCWSSETRHLTHRASSREDDTFDTAQDVGATALVAVDATEAERSHIVTVTAQGRPGHELVHASRTSELLVIGSTTRHAMSRRAGKTVVDHCLRFSDVPVLVVPFAPPELDQHDIDRELGAATSDEGADLPVRYDPFALSSGGPQTS